MFEKETVGRHFGEAFDLGGCNLSFYYHLLTTSTLRKKKLLELQKKFLKQFPLFMSCVSMARLLEINESSITLFLTEVH